MNERRSLTLGVVLLALGIFFLLWRRLDWSGPGPILLLIGAALLTASALRGFRGPLLPGGVLLGLGAGFVLHRRLEPLFPFWATLLLGLGGGFLLVAALDSFAGRQRRPAPLFPGVVLVGVAVGAALVRSVYLSEVLSEVAHLWPWALVVAGVILLLQSLLRRKT